MHSFSRFLQLFVLVLWIGGIVFFSFVVAPALFSTLPNVEMAGHVVSRSLAALHYIGLVCGAVFLVASVFSQGKRPKAMRGLIVLMMLLTAISQFGIIPQMRHLREAAGTIEALPPKDAGRAAFDRLHQISVILEGVVLISGIAVVGLISREEDKRIS
jgi:hypothetical protein